jgi:acetoin utilization deacetylase AcuC-like enzyme
MTTGIVQDPIFIEHLMGIPHVESPQRLEVLYEMLEEVFSSRLTSIPMRPATPDEMAYIHRPDYIRQLSSTAGKRLVYLDSDTKASARSYEIAVLAVGGLFALVDALMEGAIHNGFALTRPPGHHAEAHRGMGFCLLNSIALAAEYGRHRHGLNKILIVDWDLHHGNGTQHAFWDSRQVLYFSTHESPLYPGTGDIRDVGGPRAEGFTVNVPLSGGYGDEEFEEIFKRILLPIAHQFQPEMILVSAGFDTYVKDPLGSQQVTPAGFARMTRLLLQLAQEVCQGRILLTLEGGYHLEGLRLSVKAVLKELLGESILPEKQPPSSALRDLAVIDRVWAVQKKYWKKD